MTEDEAKTKWCPFAVGVVDDGIVGPRPHIWRDIGKGSSCCASAYMAWQVDSSIKSGDGFIHHGHCGLAHRG